MLPRVGTWLWWAALRLHLHGSGVEALKKQWRLQHLCSALQGLTSAGHTAVAACACFSERWCCEEGGGQDATVVLPHHSMLCMTHKPLLPAKRYQSLASWGHHPLVAALAWSHLRKHSSDCRQCKHALHLTFETAIVGAATEFVLVGPAARVLRRRPVLQTAVAAGAAGWTGSLACDKRCGDCHGCCSRHSGGYAGLCLQEEAGGSGAAGDVVPSAGRASLYGCHAGHGKGHWVPIGCCSRHCSGHVGLCLRERR